MAKVTKNEFKATVNWLKNYIDRKISSSGSGGSTTTPVTKEYIDNKIMCSNYETLYTIPTSDIPTDKLQNNAMYVIGIDYYLDIDKNGEYMISYGGNDMVAVVDSPFDEMDVVKTTGTTNCIEITPGWIPDPDNNNQKTEDKSKSAVELDNMDLTNVTDIVIKKKLQPVSGNIKALSKVDLDALTKQEDNTIYIITE